MFLQVSSFIIISPIFFLGTIINLTSYLCFIVDITFNNVSPFTLVCGELQFLISSVDLTPSSATFTANEGTSSSVATISSSGKVITITPKSTGSTMFEVEATASGYAKNKRTVKVIVE